MSFKQFLSIVLIGLLPCIILGNENTVNFNRIVNKITINGIKHIPKNEIPKTSSFQVKTGKRILETSLINDLNTLYLTGYFSEVKAHSTEHVLGMTLEFTVKENPVIRAIIITGNQSLTPQTLLPHLKNKIGQTLNIAYMKEDHTTITTLFKEKGFELTTIEKISFDQKTASVLIHLSERIIDDIHFEGLNIIEPFILNRNIQLKKGLPFNSITLRKDRQRLYQLGYFSSISSPRFTPDPNHQDKVDITYTLKERKSNLINLGFEQEDDKIVSFLQGNIHHTLIHSDVISAKIQMEPIEDQYSVRSYAVKYHQPWVFNKANISFTTDIWTEFEREFLTKDLNKTTLYHTQRNGWDVIFGFPLIYEKLNLFFKYNNEHIKHKENTTIFTPYSINSLSGKLDYLTIKNRQNPKKGSYWTFEVEKGGDLGLAKSEELNFTRLSLNVAHFFSFKKKSTLGLRYHLGDFSPKANSSDTFEAEGFVIGGANSLRGFKETNHPFIGNKQILFNTELRYSFNDLFQGVLFYDLGNTFQTKKEVSLSELEIGKGIGVRFFTPVGPLRIDLSLGDDMIIHFGLGQLF